MSMRDDMSYFRAVVQELMTTARAHGLGEARKEAIGLARAEVEEEDPVTAFFAGFVIGGGIVAVILTAIMIAVVLSGRC